MITTLPETVLEGGGDEGLGVTRSDMEQADARGRVMNLAARLFASGRREAGSVIGTRRRRNVGGWSGSCSQLTNLSWWCAWAVATIPSSSRDGEERMLATLVE